MVAARILKPQSKLATTRWWFTTTLPDMLGLDQVDADELYETMDWLLEQQSHIEKKLASRHLEEGGLALYDLMGPAPKREPVSAGRTVPADGV